MNSKFFFIGVFFVLVVIFFKSVFINNSVPIAADTIVGLYHPFRDLYSKEYPRGIPFKNFLITDPVRQQFPWRYLAIEAEKKFQLPLWNPYSLAGTPLLANFQGAVFYPLNIVFAFLPFTQAWTVLIILQPLLGGIFMFLYLRIMKISTISATLGGLCFAFSGFSIAWMQWNTVFHVILWLPLILLAKEMLLRTVSLRWIAILLFAETCAIFAGHLQTLFYTLLVSNAYLVARIVQLHSLNQKSKSMLPFFFTKYKLFLLIGVVLAGVSSVQWYPTLQFISYSARDVDQVWQSQEGWFIPLQHLIQFVAPDFFGNPATLNYWGIWNYAEFIGYIGIFPLMLAFVALVYRRDKKTLFYGSVLLTALLSALPTPLAKIPFLLDIPLISSSQPTRLIGIVTFCLSVLAAFGLDYFLKHRKVRLSLILFGAIFGLLWIYILIGSQYVWSIPAENLAVAKRNLILPSVLFVLSIVGLLSFHIVKQKRFSYGILLFLLFITVYDLFRFGDKFLPFTTRAYLFPNTKTIEFLQKNTGNYRIMTIDDRILPPNFSIMYKLQTVSGYDPLYLQRYGELIAASERGKPDISPPFGFNRIITPKNYDSSIVDLLGVKYVLSLTDINSPKLKKVFQEGETQVYENSQAFPRVFFVKQIYYSKDKQDEINALFREDIDLRKVAVMEYAVNPQSGKMQAAPGSFSANFLQGTTKIVSFSENKIIVETNSPENGFLVITESFYPTWHVKIDGSETWMHRVNFHFRGLSVPEGKHTVEFYNTLF